MTERAEPETEPQFTPPHGDELAAAARLDRDAVGPGPQESAQPEADPGGDTDGGAEFADPEVGIEDLEDDLAKLVAERDEYLALARRVQADFENFRKRMLKQGADERNKGAAQLVEKLLPALDAFDAALAHDDAKTHVGPIYDVLMDVLEKEGLAVLYPAGEPFDPTVHDAVVHEPGEEGEEPTVTEVLRSGYLWKGKVLRPALVKVRG